jgi:hypothetical protein
LKDANVNCKTNFGALWITAKDGDRPIHSARHILITGVGPAKNTGMEYEMTERKSRLGHPYARLSNMGTSPILMEAVVGTVEIKNSNNHDMKAWALDIVGKRIQEITLIRESENLILRMEPKYKTVYYEISTD